jgi:hypothetical protein
MLKYALYLTLKVVSHNFKGTNEQHILKFDIFT